VSATRDIFRAWIRPREVMRARLAHATEGVALGYLASACLLIFVAQWPRLSRQAFETGAELQPLLGGALMGWIFVAPLLLYGLAALARLVARPLGGQGTGLKARTALFWSLLAVAPVMLLHGLTAGFVGPGPALDLVGASVLAGFFWLWGNAIAVAERPAATI
jgi:hypothetical protein